MRKIFFLGMNEKSQKWNEKKSMQLGRAVIEDWGGVYMYIYIRRARWFKCCVNEASTGWLSVTAISYRAHVYIYTYYIFRWCHIRHLFFRDAYYLSLYTLSPDVVVVVVVASRIKEKFCINCCICVPVGKFNFSLRANKTWNKSENVNVKEREIK